MGSHPAKLISSRSTNTRWKTTRGSILTVHPGAKCSHGLRAVALSCRSLRRTAQHCVEDEAEQYGDFAFGNCPAVNEALDEQRIGGCPQGCRCSLDGNG